MEQLEQIGTKDGHQLGIISYRPADPLGIVVVIGSDLSLGQDFYRAFASFLCGQGFSVISFDYRGTGRSHRRQKPQNSISLRQWAFMDLDAILRFVKNRYPNQELIFIGHGLSGEMVGLAPASQFISRMVLVCSALSSRMLWPKSHQFAIAAFQMLYPVISRLQHLMPIDHNLTQPIWNALTQAPREVVHERNEWARHPNGLFDLFPDSNYRKLDIQVLSYSFADDLLAPKNAVASLLTYLPNASIKWRHIDPKMLKLDKVGHNGFFQDMHQSTLWEELLQWCLTR